MTTELKVLKQILKDDKKAPIQLIAKQLEMGNDYIRYLCQELLRKGLIKKLERRDWYEIIQKGRQRLEVVEKSVTEEHPVEKYIPPKKGSKNLPAGKAGKIKKKIPEEEKPKKITKKKAGKKILKKVKIESKKRAKEKVLEIQKNRIKIPFKLRSRKRGVIKNENERKTIPLEKQLERQSKKAIKFFRNLFQIKRD